MPTYNSTLMALAKHTTMKLAAARRQHNKQAAGEAMPPMDPAMMGGGAPPMDPAMMAAGAPPPPLDPMLGGGAPSMGPPGMQPPPAPPPGAAPAAGGGGAGGKKQDVQAMLAALDTRIFNMQQQLTAALNAMNVKLDPSVLVMPPGSAGTPPAEAAMQGAPFAPAMASGGGAPPGGASGGQPKTAAHLAALRLASASRAAGVSADELPRLLAADEQRAQKAAAETARRLALVPVLGSAPLHERASAMRMMLQARRTA